MQKFPIGLAKFPELQAAQTFVCACVRACALVSVCERERKGPRGMGREGTIKREK